MSQLKDSVDEFCQKSRCTQRAKCMVSRCSVQHHLINVSFRNWVDQLGESDNFVRSSRKVDEDVSKAALYTDDDDLFLASHGSTFALTDFSVESFEFQYPHEWIVHFICRV